MKKFMLFLMVASLVVIAQVQALEPLTVENYSFELPGTGKIQCGFDCTPDVPGWKGGAGGDTGVENASRASDGVWSAFLRTADAAVYQVINKTISLGDTYVLTIDAFDLYGAGALDVMGFYYTSDGGVTLNALYTESVASTGTYQEFSVTHTVTNSAAVGSNLVILFDDTADTTGWGGWTTIDNVRLSGPAGDCVRAQDPADGETRVDIDLSDRTIVNNFSWLAPTDPNIAAIKGYDLYLDPNSVKVSNREAGCLIAASLAAGVTQYDPAINFDYLKTYFWVVDTRYTRDDDPNLGTPNEHIYIGAPSVWSFQTVSAAPVIDTFNSVITVTTLLPAQLSAIVVDGDNNLSTAALTLLSDDAEFPAGATASLQNLNVTNLYAPSVQLVTDMAGTYKVKLTVTDALANSAEAIAEVVVYAAADACAAAQAAASWAGFNAMDFDTDCDVDLEDLAAFAAQWLDDTTLQAAESFVSSPIYVPQSVLNARIEAESNTTNVSDAPLTDETGIRVVNEAGATGGGQAIGYCANGVWAEFSITVQAAVYDVWVSTSSGSVNPAGTLNFGTAETPDLYGSVGPFTGTWFGDYHIEKFAGALDFTTAGAGTYTVRITWADSSANLDWFTLVQQ